MKRKFLIVVLALMAVSFFGCASTGVVPAGPDTYIISEQGFGLSSIAVRKRVFQKANEFCSSRGLVMVPISFKAHDGAVGSSAPFASLTFRALKPGDPAANRPGLFDVSDRTAVTQDISLSVKDDTNQTRADIYAELLKLEDLRKRGILTEEEFNAAKKRLLSK